MKCKSTESVEKCLAELQRLKPSAVSKFLNVPREQQFPACAVEQGYGPTYGVNTSNSSEVSTSEHASPACSARNRNCSRVRSSNVMQAAWTMFKNIRCEQDMYEQFVRSAAVMQKHWLEGQRLIRTLENRNSTLPDKVLAVSLECRSYGS